MAINIKNREAEQLLNTLSRRAHLGKSQLVLELLRREAARQARVSGAPARKKQILALSKRAAWKIGRGAPSPERIIGYGPDGLPR